ncbi:hypothetical protein LTR08_001687 [Meristemomyces frigidus]|nr:hypothetical protein LTR08_001687 [Meristemomyces frigidus]
MARRALYIITLAAAVASLCLVHWLVISAPPAAQDASTYDEAEIVGLVTEIYKVLIRSGIYNDNEVVWAPPEGHAVDLSLLNNADGIDERVISLMKKLPTGPSAHLAEYMQPESLLRQVEFVRSRDVDMRPSDETGLEQMGRADHTNALPTVPLLLDGWVTMSPVLVLDVASNTIRHFDAVYNGPHYLDFAAENAATYLERMLENYRTPTWAHDLVDGIVVTYPYNEWLLSECPATPEPLHPADDR